VSLLLLFEFMPRPIFEIDELLRLVVDELVETSPRAAVSFALTCRSHEEPTLSSLWGKQVSLTVLVMVSPSCTWVKDEDGIEAIVSGCNFPAHLIPYSPPLPRQLNVTLQRWNGLGCDDTLPGCVD